MIDVDGDVAGAWARIRARRSAPVIDALIAATASVHDLTVVTRNARDFEALDVKVLNPWRL